MIENKRYSHRDLQKIRKMKNIIINYNLNYISNNEINALVLRTYDKYFQNLNGIREEECIYNEKSILLKI